jgi:hypothetical protein
MPLLKLLLIAALVFFITIITGCSTSSSKLNEPQGLKIIVSSTTGTHSAAAKSRQIAADSGLVRDGQKFSFTPTSLKVTLNTINIFQKWTTAGDGSITGGGNEISISANSTFDLISPAALSDLYTKEISVESDKFGTYIGAKVLLNDTVLLSGAATVNGKTYTITDMKTRIGFTGQQYAFSSPLVIGDTAADSLAKFAADSATDSVATASLDATVRLIFDLDWSAILSYVGDSTSGDYATPAVEGNVRMHLGNVCLIPYVGAGLPTIEKYKITVDDDTTYALRLLLLADPSDVLTAASIQPVYFAGFGDSSFVSLAIDPVPYQICTIIKTGDTYSIAKDTTFGTNSQTADREVSFPAFKRTATQTGTLIYGYPNGTPRNYSAVQYEVIKE